MHQPPLDQRLKLGGGPEPGQRHHLQPVADRPPPFQRLPAHGPDHRAAGSVRRRGGDHGRAPGRVPGLPVAGDHRQRAGLGAVPRLGRYRWLDALLAALIVFFGVILTGLARDTYRVFAESVLIRQQRSRATSSCARRCRRRNRPWRPRRASWPRPATTCPAHAHAVAVRCRAGQAPAGRGGPRHRHADESGAAIAVLADGRAAGHLQAGRQRGAGEQPGLRAPALAGAAAARVPAGALRKQLLLRRFCPPEACVESPPVLLERVVRNLIDNAIKYTQRGEVAVEVSRGQDEGRLAPIGARHRHGHPRARTGAHLRGVLSGR
ncbi:hypothetical protein Ddc_24139 [Ditylenchus destructor]|nr:hypothetical protein Ddc_24139 [Ditylenchus destructor]